MICGLAGEAIRQTVISDPQLMTSGRASLAFPSHSLSSNPSLLRPSRAISLWALVTGSFSPSRGLIHPFADARDI